MSHRMNPGRPARRRATISGMLIASLTFAGTSLPLGQHNYVYADDTVVAETVKTGTALPYTASEETQGSLKRQIVIRNQNAAEIYVGHVKEESTTTTGQRTTKQHAFLGAGDRALISVTYTNNSSEEIKTLKHTLTNQSSDLFKNLTLQSVTVASDSDTDGVSLGESDINNLSGGQEITLSNGQTLKNSGSVTFVYSLDLPDIYSSDYSSELFEKAKIAFTAALSTNNNSIKWADTSAFSLEGIATSRLSITTEVTNSSYYLGVYPKEAIEGSLSAKTGPENPIVRKPVADQPINLSGLPDGVYAASLYYMTGDNRFIPVGGTTTAEITINNDNQSNTSSLSDALADKRAETLAYIEKYLRDSAVYNEALNTAIEASTESDLDDFWTVERTASDQSKYTYFAKAKDTVQTRINEALFLKNNEDRFLATLKAAENLDALDELLTDAITTKKEEIKTQIEAFVPQEQQASVKEQAENASTLYGITAPLVPYAVSDTKKSIEALYQLVSTIRAEDKYNYPDDAADLESLKVEKDNALNALNSAQTLQALMAQYTSVISAATQVLDVNTVTPTDYRRKKDIDLALAQGYASSRLRVLVDPAVFNLTSYQVDFYRRSMNEKTVLEDTYNVYKTAGAVSNTRAQIQGILDEMDETRSSTLYSRSTTSAREQFDDAYNQILGYLSNDPATAELSVTAAADARTTYNNVLEILRSNFIDVPDNPNNIMRGLIATGLGIAASGTIIALVDFLTGGAIQRIFTQPGIALPFAPAPEPQVDTTPAQNLPYPAPTRDNEPTILSVTGASARPYVAAALVLMVVGTVFYIEGRLRKHD